MVPPFLLVLSFTHYRVGGQPKLKSGCSMVSYLWVQRPNAMTLSMEKKGVRWMGFVGTRGSRQVVGMVSFLIFKCTFYIGALFYLAGRSSPHGTPIMLGT